MRPDDLPPPKAGFIRDSKADNRPSNNVIQSGSGSQGRAVSREQGGRHVSFETGRGDTEQSAVTTAPTPNPSGPISGTPAPSSAAQVASLVDAGGSVAASPLSFSLPPSRLGPGGVRGRQGRGPTAAVDSAGTVTQPPASSSEAGVSDMSLTLNASMRRTKRRHAAAAATTLGGQILGPAPIPAAAAAAVAAAAAARAASGSGAATATSAETAVPPSRLGSPDRVEAARQGAEAVAALATGILDPASAKEQEMPGGNSVDGAIVGVESTAVQPPAPLICGPLYTKPTPPNVLAVTIAQSENLRLDPLLTNPVVRVHCLDANTGHYLASLDDPTTGLLDAVKAMQILEYAGRPSQMTIGNNSDYPAATILRVIPPIQTEPFHLLSRPEARTMAAWEETLLIDEAAERFVALDPLLIFEVLQPAVSYQRYHKHIRAFDTEDGSHLVAWAFLRPAGPRPETPDGPRQPLFGRLKLQLYEYKEDISDAVRISSKAAEAAAQPSASAGAGAVHGPEGAPAPLQLNAASRAYVNWQALMAEGGAAVVPKYPSALTVVLQAVRRPEPEVVITEPAKNIRPYLPAGYGSGFETSKIPLSAYLGREGGASGNFHGEEAEDITKHKLYRPITEPCKVPNAFLRKLPGGPQGVTCLAFSNGGTMMAVVSSEADDRTRIEFYGVLTGSLKNTIRGAHSGFVYDVAWARDDSAIITASADGTAKIWELNPMAAAAAMKAVAEATAAAAAGGGHAARVSVADAAEAAAAAAPAMNLLATMAPRRAAAAAAAASAGGPNPNTSLNASKPGGVVTASITSSGSMPAPALAGIKGGSNVPIPPPTILHHACYVYTALFHPVQKPGSALVATGAYDGTVRLWRRYTGELLAAVKTQSGCINSLCFDKLGTRLYAGDSAGVLQEFSCDVSKGLDAVAAAPGGTNLKISTISGANSGSGLNATLMSSTIRKRMTGTQRSAGSGGAPAPVNLNASMLPRSKFNFSASMRPAPAAAGGADGDGSQAAQPAPGGLNATQGSATAVDSTAEAAAAVAAAAAANILRVLRQCDEFDGEPLAHVFPHHDGRRLGLLTKRSRLLVVETRSLSKAEQFLGFRCREAPLKATFSPDGRYLVCGSEDGRVFIWDADGGPPTLLPNWTLGGDTVYQVAWNPQFHIVAVCSFASWAPILMLGYDNNQPDVALQMGHKNPLELMARDRKKAQKPRPRWDIPDQLTPEFLRIMIGNVRRDALERGIIGDPNDPNGDHLVVPRSRLAELRANKAAAEAAVAAAAMAPQPPATPPEPTQGSFAAGVDVAMLAELPGSRFQTPQLEGAASGDKSDGDDDGKDHQSRLGKLKSNVHFADELPPPTFKEPRPPSPPPSPIAAKPESSLTEGSSATVAEAEAGAGAPALPQQQLQEYQWSHPQAQKRQEPSGQPLAPLTPPPPSAALAASSSPVRLRQQQQEYARQQLQVAQQQHWRYPAAAAVPPLQVPYTRTLYGLEQQYEWQKEVQAPDPLQYSQWQRAVEHELREGPKQYPLQPREVQLQQYRLQQQQLQQLQQQLQQHQYSQKPQQYALQKQKQQRQFEQRGQLEPYDENSQYGQQAALELYQMQPVMQVQPAAMQRQQQQQQQQQRELLQYGTQQGYQLQPQYVPAVGPQQPTTPYNQQHQQQDYTVQQQQQVQRSLHPQGYVGARKVYSVQPPYFATQQAHGLELPYAQQRSHGQKHLQQQYGSHLAQPSGHVHSPQQYALQQMWQQYELQPRYGVPQMQVQYG